MKYTMVLILTLFISAPAFARDWTAPFYGRPGSIADERIRQVQRVIPPAPVSRIGDGATIVWVYSGTISATGNYTKTNNSSSRMWKENTFGDYADSFTNCTIESTGGANYPCSTPLTIDLDRNWFEFGNEETGVVFDFKADGFPRLHHWFESGTKDGLLAVDWNQNGMVDDGSELFGDGTTILSTGKKAANGYQALDQFDTTQLGGNNDGEITLKDDIWSKLMLWIDTNADGISEASEIRLLSDFDIIKISLTTNETGKRKRTDAYGNFIPYWSWVTTESKKGPRKLKMVDVYFKTIQ